MLKWWDVIRVVIRNQIGVWHCTKIYDSEYGENMQGVLNCPCAPVLLVRILIICYWLIFVSKFFIVTLQRRLFYCTTMYSEEYWVRICSKDNQHKEVVSKRLVLSLLWLLFWWKWSVAVVVHNEAFQVLAKDILFYLQPTCTCLWLQAIMLTRTLTLYLHAYFFHSCLLEVQILYMLSEKVDVESGSVFILTIALSEIGRWLLSDPQPGFQGHCILTSRISQKWCILETKLL